MEPLEAAGGLEDAELRPWLEGRGCSPLASEKQRALHALRHPGPGLPASLGPWRAGSPLARCCWAGPRSQPLACPLHRPGVVWWPCGWCGVKPGTVPDSGLALTWAPCSLLSPWTLGSKAGLRQRKIPESLLWHLSWLLAILLTKT